MTARWVMRNIWFSACWFLKAFRFFCQYRQRGLFCCKVGKQQVCVLSLPGNGAGDWKSLWWEKAVWSLRRKVIHPADHLQHRSSVPRKQRKNIFSYPAPTPVETPLPWKSQSQWIHQKNNLLYTIWYAAVEQLFYSRYSNTNGMTATPLPPLHKPVLVKAPSICRTHPHHSADCCAQARSLRKYPHLLPHSDHSSRNENTTVPISSMVSTSMSVVP